MQRVTDGLLFGGNVFHGYGVCGCTIHALISGFQAK
jgi:hypothetical protein